MLSDGKIKIASIFLTCISSDRKHLYNQQCVPSECICDSFVSQDNRLNETTDCLLAVIELPANNIKRIDPSRVRPVQSDGISNIFSFCIGIILRLTKRRQL